jgi:hypothetical protein
MGISGPPATCCGRLREVLGTPEAICLCHVMGGELNEYAHTTINPLRLALLPSVCLAIAPPQLPAMCLSKDFSVSS